MKKSTLSVCFCLIGNFLFAQSDQIYTVPLVAEEWTFKAGQVEFTKEEGKRSMKILSGREKVVAKNLDFSEGIIEFDVKPNSMTFYFHYRDAMENECFYFRMGQSGKPMALEAVQYAPIIDGVLMWDIYPHYQSNANFTKGDWNHVKMVISNGRMRVFINNPDRPALEVNRLAGNPEKGTLAFEGEMTVSNLTITPETTGTQLPLKEMDPTHNDPRYIRSWAVSDPVAIPEKVDFSYDLLPSPKTPWRVLETEWRGLVNLTRTFGSNDTRSMIWLKVGIESTMAQRKKVNLGFVDDVWVFLNGQMVYLDKNLQGRLMEKDPGGRCSIENTSFTLPLKEGANELLVGLANDPFWGRGAMARLEDMEGITIAPDPTFDSRLVDVPAELIDTYIGNYSLSSGTRVSVGKEDGILTLSSEGFPTILLYPMAENRFFSREDSMEVEFVKDGGNRVANFTIYRGDKSLMDAKRMD
ncbi:hypothetical protein [Ulvibacterium sp.]|uniref:hypothetical protein n=1 Tax=Ulvibacterium sp. TaxID=2665914 RepID=UPI003BAD7FF1